METKMETKTDPTTGHTPTPWLVYGRATKTSNFGNYRARVCADLGVQKATIAYTLGGDQDEPAKCEANAALIVRAVNAHDALVAALTFARRVIQHHGVSPGSIGTIDAALALARGEA